MTPADPLAAASIFLTAPGAVVGAAPDPEPEAGPPGAFLWLGKEGQYLTARLSPDAARRLGHALLAAADYLRAAYHAWEQEQSGVATPPLPFEYPEVKE